MNASLNEYIANSHNESIAFILVRCVLINDVDCISYILIVTMHCYITLLQLHFHYSIYNLRLKVSVECLVAVNC